jgi:hypothetical protein
MNISSRKFSVSALALIAALGMSSVNTLAEPTPLAPSNNNADPTATPLPGGTGEGENGNQDPPAASAQPTQGQPDLDRIQNQLDRHEQLLVGSDIEIGPLSFNGSDLFAGGGLFVALIALGSGITAHLQLRRSHQSLRKHSDSLRARLSELELQVEQDRVVNRARQTSQAASTRGQANPPVAAKPTTPPFQPVATAVQSTPASTPAPQPLVPPPALVSKAGLIAALNSGDRQQVRDAAKAELNITNESENAIATGRATSTELEEVGGGGSYWLIALDQQHWLFPTDRTLKGFAAAQPAKGLFEYEKQTIAEPQLIEPAQLNSNGDRWVVASMGRIGTP